MDLQTMVERPEHAHTARADAIAHGQQLFVVIDVEGHVLHGAAALGLPGLPAWETPICVGDVLDGRRRHEGNRAVRVQGHEGMEIPLYAARIQ